MPDENVWRVFDSDAYKQLSEPEQHQVVNRVFSKNPRVQGVSKEARMLLRQRLITARQTTPQQPQAPAPSPTPIPSPTPVPAIQAPAPMPTMQVPQIRAPVPAPLRAPTEQVGQPTLAPAPVQRQPMPAPAPPPDRLMPAPEVDSAAMPQFHVEPEPRVEDDLIKAGEESHARLKAVLKLTGRDPQLSERLVKGEIALPDLPESEEPKAAFVDPDSLATVEEAVAVLVTNPSYLEMPEAERTMAFNVQVADHPQWEQLSPPQKRRIREQVVTAPRSAEDMREEWRRSPIPVLAAGGNAAGAWVLRNTEFGRALSRSVPTIAGSTVLNNLAAGLQNMVDVEPRGEFTEEFKKVFKRARNPLTALPKQITEEAKRALVQVPGAEQAIGGAAQRLAETSADIRRAVEEVVPPAKAATFKEALESPGAFTDYLSQLAGSQVPIVGGITGATLMGGPAGGMAAGIALESGLIGADTWDAAGKIDPQTQAAAGALAGALEVMPWVRFLDRIGAGKGATTFSRYAAQQLKNMGRQSAEEALTEGAQGLVEQLAVQYAADNQIDLGQLDLSQIGEEMIAGGIFGGGMYTAGAGVTAPAAIQQIQTRGRMLAAQAKMDEARGRLAATLRESGYSEQEAADLSNQLSTGAIAPEQLPPPGPPAPETAQIAPETLPAEPEAEVEIEPEPGRRSEERRVATAAELEEDRRAEERRAGVERREDVVERKRIADMTEEELRQELLVDNLTGLGSKRAYDEAEIEPSPAIASVDADSLKAINDLFGHESGDRMLTAIGDAIRQHTDRGFHPSGDEFIITGTTEEELQSVLGNVNTALDQTELVYTDNEGKQWKASPRITYGIAETYQTADERLGAEKAAREARGERAGRGERPIGLVEVTPEGREARDQEEEVEATAPTEEREPPPAEVKPQPVSYYRSALKDATAPAEIDAVEEEARAAGKLTPALSRAIGRRREAVAEIETRTGRPVREAVDRRKKDEADQFLDDLQQAKTSDEVTALLQRAEGERVELPKPIRDKAQMKRIRLARREARRKPPKKVLEAEERADKAARKAREEVKTFTEEQLEAAASVTSTTSPKIAARKQAAKARLQDMKLERERAELRTVEPTEAEVEAVEKGPDKTDRTGLTKPQKQHLAAKIKEEYPSIAEGEAVRIEVPEDGTFTVRDAEAANDLHQVMTGKPVRGPKRRTEISPTRVEPPLLSQLTFEEEATQHIRGVGKAAALQRLVAAGVEIDTGEDLGPNAPRGATPIVVNAKSAAWDGNVTDSDRYVTDNAVIIDKQSLVKKAPPWLARRDKDTGRAEAQEASIKKVLARFNKGAENLTFPEWQARRGDKNITALYTDDGRAVIIDADRAGNIIALTGADSAVVAKKGHVGFKKNGDLVAVLMPLGDTSVEDARLEPKGSPMEKLRKDLAAATTVEAVDAIESAAEEFGILTPSLGRSLGLKRAEIKKAEPLAKVLEQVSKATSVDGMQRIYDEAVKNFPRREDRAEVARAISERSDELKAKPVTEAEEEVTGDIEGPLGAPRRVLSNENPGRIAPAPWPAPEKQKRLDEIISNFAADIDKRIRKSIVPGTGQYDPSSGRISIRHYGDLDATAHDTSHHLDDTYNVVGWMNEDTRTDKLGRVTYKPNPKYDPELKKFWRTGSITKTGPRSRLPYKRAEGFGEWVRALIVNPEAAVAAAPEINRLYEERVPKEVRDAVTRFSQDVRQHVATQAIGQVLGNVRVVPDSLGERLLAKTKTALGNQPGDFTTQDVWTRMQTKLSDDLAPIVKAVTTALEIRGGRDLLPANDPRVLMRLYHGHTEKMESILDGGMINTQLRPVTGNVDWMLSPLDASSKEALQRDYEGVIALLLSERVLEKTKRITDEAQERAANLSEERAQKVMEAAQEEAARIAGWGAGLQPDFVVAARAIDELKSDPQRYERLSEAARRYREWADATLRYMVDGGRLSEDAYDRIVSENEQYAAMNRFADEADQQLPKHLRRGPTRKLGAVRQVVQRFRGSTRVIENPFVNLLVNTSSIVAETDRNRVMQTFSDLLSTNRKMYQGPVQDLDAIGSKVTKDDPGAIKIYKDGKAEHWQFEEGVHEALKKLGQQPDVPGFLRFLPDVLRRSVVMSPPFLIRNKIRDALQAAVISEHGVKPWDLRFTRKQLEQWQRAGGGQAGHYASSRENYHKVMRMALRELSQDGRTVIGTAESIANGYSKLARLSETSTRMAEYNRAYRHAKDKLGYDDFNASLYAAAESRGLIDFAVSGSWIRWINAVVPFTNPQIQGVKRVFRSVRSREAAKRTVARWVPYILMPKLAEYAWASWNGDDDELRQQPPYIRDLFMSFKIGPDLWLRIPLGFDLAVYAAAVNRLIDYSLGNEKAFEGLWGNVWKSLVPLEPSSFAGPFRAMVETMTNYDFFRERHVIPTWEEGRAIERRPGAARASRLGWFGTNVAKAVGVEVDPRNIDHIIKGQLADVGRALMSLSDIGREDKANPDYLRATGLTIRAPGYSAQDVQAVLKKAKHLGLEQHKDVKKMAAMFKATHDPDPAKRDKAKEDLRLVAASIREWLDPVTPQQAAVNDRIREALEIDIDKPRDQLYNELQAAGVLVGDRKSFKTRYRSQRKEILKERGE